MAFLDLAGLTRFKEKLETLFTKGPANSTANHIATFDGTTGKMLKDSGYTIAKSVPSDAKFTDTTYSSKTAASGGTDVSLVTTGEKYTWNSKVSCTSANIKLALGTTANTSKYFREDGTWAVPPETKLLVVSVTTSSLPVTISNAEITADMEVIKSDLSDPNVQNGDLTVTTSAGSATISGSLTGSTTITLWLMYSR